MTFPLDQEPAIRQRLADARYDITQAAIYADLVCRGMCNDRDALRGQFEGHLETKYSLKSLRKLRKQLNLTSLGNCAYQALNAVSPYNEMAQKVYWRIVEVLTDGAIKSDIDNPKYQHSQTETILPESMHKSVLPCFVCKAIPTKCCSGCRTIRYCSQECQKIDWPRHKKECLAKPDSDL